MSLSPRHSSNAPQIHHDNGCQPATLPSPIARCAFLQEVKAGSKWGHAQLIHISSHHVSCEVVKKDWTWLKCTVLSPDTIEWFIGLATVQEHHLPRSSVPNPLRWRSCQLLALRWAPQVEASSAKTKQKETTEHPFHLALWNHSSSDYGNLIHGRMTWYGRWILKTWKIQWHPYQHQHQSQAKILDCSFVDVPKFGWFAPAPQPGRREDPSFLPLRPINKEW